MTVCSASPSTARSPAATGQVGKDCFAGLAAEVYAYIFSIIYRSRMP
jgi:hypothetical protein